MRLLRYWIAGFPVLPVCMVIMVSVTGAGWSQIAAAIFPLIALSMRRYGLFDKISPVDPAVVAQTPTWLFFPAALLTAMLLPVGFTREATTVDVVRLAAFVVVALMFPTRFGGWQTSTRWMVTTAVLVAPDGFFLGGMSMPVLLPLLQLVFLADLIRTGLSARDLRPDRLLNAVGLGVIVALQRNLPWVPILILAAAMLELMVAGAVSHQVRVPTPSHDHHRRWHSRGRFTAAFAVSALMWWWVLAQLAPFGRHIHELGPRVVARVQEMVARTLAPSGADRIKLASKSPKARTAQRDGTTPPSTTPPVESTGFREPDIEITPEPTEPIVSDNFVDRSRATAGRADIKSLRPALETSPLRLPSIKPGSASSNSPNGNVPSRDAVTAPVLENAGRPGVEPARSEAAANVMPSNAAGSTATPVVPEMGVPRFPSRGGGGNPSPEAPRDAPARTVANASRPSSPATDDPQKSGLVPPVDAGNVNVKQNLPRIESRGGERLPGQSNSRGREADRSTTFHFNPLRDPLDPASASSARIGQSSSVNETAGLAGSSGSQAGTAPQTSGSGNGAVGATASARGEGSSRSELMEDARVGTTPRNAANGGSNRTDARAGGGRSEKTGMSVQPPSRSAASGNGGTGLATGGGRASGTNSGGGAGGRSGGGGSGMPSGGGFSGGAAGGGGGGAGIARPAGGEAGGGTGAGFGVSGGGASDSSQSGAAGNSNGNRAERTPSPTAAPNTSSPSAAGKSSGAVSAMSSSASPRDMKGPANPANRTQSNSGSAGTAGAGSPTAQVGTANAISKASSADAPKVAVTPPAAAPIAATPNVAPAREPAPREVTSAVVAVPAIAPVANPAAAARAESANAKVDFPISENETIPPPPPAPPQTETPVPPALSTPPAHVQPAAASRVVDYAASAQPWRLPIVVVVMMLGLMAALMLRRRAQMRQRTATARFPIEDRSLAGRCLCEIEELLARPASPEISAQLSQLHRLGLGLRYGVEFSRRQVAHVEDEARRIRRVIEAFERSMARRAKKAA